MCQVSGVRANGPSTSVRETPRSQRTARRSWRRTSRSRCRLGPVSCPPSHLLTYDRQSTRSYTSLSRSLTTPSHPIPSNPLPTPPPRYLSPSQTQATDRSGPEATDGRIAPRSGLASKNFIDTGAGVIDADYRGMVKVLLFNFSEVDFEGSFFLSFHL